MQKYELDIIGTHLSLLIDTKEECSSLFEIINIRLIAFEKNFSRFIEGNWLYNLNRDRRGELDNDGKNMLIFMLSLADLSEGYFDPTIGKRLTELGYGNQKILQLGNEALKENRKYTGNYKDIEIIGDEVILHGNIILEFGGVGKGYLIDVIQSIIQDAGLKTRYLINFGGDMYGCGGWKVGLENPFASDEVIGMMDLQDDFLACSAGTKRKWGKHHHLINPHTLESAHDVVASFIEGDTGIITDAYATTLCVMPWELACETLSKTSEISGIIVRHDGSLFQKEGSKCEVFE